MMKIKGGVDAPSHRTEASKPKAGISPQVNLAITPSRPERTPSPIALPRILVVDDQEMIRAFTRTSLARAGYDVTFATNGREAVAAVCDGEFALVLMDIDMPIMNGRTAAKKIRQLYGPRSRVPIIAFSGDKQLVFGADINDCIGKPFRKAELLNKVSSWLDRSGKKTLPPRCPHSKAAFNRALLHEVYELMGRAWTKNGLAKLQTRIDETFKFFPIRGRSEGALASQAHQLVSLAALLGFSTLSDLCSSLEEACRSGGDVRKPFRQAKVAGLQAQEAAAALIANA
jgi:CheY-like chemotaxis protein/HPt (histidine-containing phosphotransfer) domain-containing protein